MRPHLLLLSLFGLAACASPLMGWTNPANQNADPNQVLLACRQDAQKQVGPDLFMPKGGEDHALPFDWSTDHAAAFQQYDQLVDSCMTGKGYKQVPVS